MACIRVFCIRLAWIRIYNTFAPTPNDSGPPGKHPPDGQSAPTHEYNLRFTFLERFMSGYTEPRTAYGVGPTHNHKLPQTSAEF